MSYEKKMKDLMARLVSMSPEPPPYPEEETPMARQESRKTVRPALAFAVAAALVAILAVPLLLFTGGEDQDPLATTTSTMAAMTTTVAPGSTSTTTSPSTTTTVPMVDAWSGVVFLYQEPENSFGQNPALVPVAVTIEGPFAEGVDFSRAMSAALEASLEMPAGLRTAIPSDVIVQSTRVEDETTFADMNEAFLDGGGGLLADFTMLNQLIYTLTYDNEDGHVLFTVNGAPVEAFGEGLDLTSVVTRETFREGNLGLIFLTEPLIESEGVYTVAGMANTFEGALVVNVLDANREATHEEPVQASSGSGTWGTFSTTIPAELITPGESSIRVFTYSAEDGSVSEAITIPIPEGDVWKLTAGG